MCSSTNLARQLCFVVMLTCIVIPAQAWDPFGIGASARKNFVQGLSQSSTIVRSAMENMEQTLFDEHINPMVDKVNSLILNDQEEIKQSVEEVVNQTAAAIDDTINNAFSQAQKFVDHTIDDIQKKIIETVSNGIQSLEQTFFRGVSQIIDKIEKLFDHIDCTIKGNVQQLLNSILSSLSHCTPLDNCCKPYISLSNPFPTVGSLTHPQQYDLQICRTVLNVENNPKSTVDQLLNAYEQGQILSREYACIDSSIATVQDHLTQEYVKWGVKYLDWKQSAVGTALRGTEAANTKPQPWAASAHPRGIREFNTTAQRSFISFQSKQ